MGYRRPSKRRRAESAGPPDDLLHALLSAVSVARGRRTLGLAQATPRKLEDAASLWMPRSPAVDQERLSLSARHSRCSLQRAVATKDIQTHRSDRQQP